MIYLSQFHFPSALAEDLALGDTFDTEYYPFRILSKREFYKMHTIRRQRLREDYGAQRYCRNTEPFEVDTL